LVQDVIYDSLKIHLRNFDSVKATLQKAEKKFNTKFIKDDDTSSLKSKNYLTELNINYDQVPMYYKSLIYKV